MSAPVSTGAGGARDGSLSETAESRQPAEIDNGTPDTVVENENGSSGKSNGDGGSQVSADSHTARGKPSTASNLSEEANFGVRSRRQPKLSLISRESKVTDLLCKMTKSITIEYRFLAKVQERLQGVLTLDGLFDDLDMVSAHVLSVIHMREEMVVLCENDPNKIPDQVKAMYHEFITQAKALRKAIERLIDQMEDEEERSEQESITQMNEELEEESRRFRQLLEETEGPTVQLLNQGQPQQITAGNQGPPDSSPAEDNRDSQQRTQEGRTTSNNAQSQADYQQDLQVSTVHLSTAGVRHEPDTSDYRTQNGTPSSQETEPGQPSTDGFSTITAFAEKFADKLAAEIRPPRKSVEPDIFCGETLKFNEWEIDLDAYFKDERIDGEAERLRHMKKFLGGDARKCVESNFIINTKEAYQQARDTLKQRYGNRHNIVRGLRKQLEEWKPIGPKDRQSLREFSDYLHQLQAAMKTMSELQILNDYSENERMVKKLPDWLKLRWTRIVANLDDREQRYPKFREFCTFVKNEADIMALPISLAISNQDRKPSKDSYSRRNQRMPKEESKSLTSFVTATGKSCLKCTMINHSTMDCFKLRDLDRETTNNFAKTNGVCFKCFEKGHRSRVCTTDLKCLVCKGQHATANHDDNFKPYKKKTDADSTTQPSNSSRTQEKKDAGDKAATTPKSSMATTTGNSLVTMAIPVKVVAENRSILVYALLDSMSDACYATPYLLKKLDMKSSATESNVTLHTMNGPETVDLKRFDNIVLSGFMNNNTSRINAYEREIYCNRSQLPSPAKAKRYPHLKDVVDHMPTLLDIPVGLLIGMNHPEIIQPMETRPAPPGLLGAPFGVRTLFGWTMGGGADMYQKDSTAFKTDLAKDAQLMAILEKDFNDVGQVDGYLSQEDKRFNEILEKETRQNSDGNYMMPLPFREEPFLPNNRAQTEKRLQGLIKRFNSDKEYKHEYTVFINKILDSGHAELVTEPSPPGKTWYIPHFAVRHKKKGTLRVVFDASVKVAGVSLNDTLMTGPEHMNSLLGILLRFRKEPFAVTCDIQQMFFNFIVEPEHRDFLRFLWVDGHDNVVDYRMRVHLFGAKSSPGVATFGLRRAAKDYNGISESASRFLQDDFYVDDGVVSLPTREAAIRLISEATEICSKANIRLHKFLSNDKEILASVPESERGESTKGIDLLDENLPTERTLGMKWDLEMDTFYFNEPETVKVAPTKRIMLSTIAQVYDPMGLVSPVMLKGKRLLQEVTASELPWDQLLSQDDADNWISWVNQLQGLSQLNLKRCIKPQGQVVTTELHHFSDASINGYAACSYVRQITEDRVVATNLVLAKARVTPLNKPTTIPRLELQGALTATKLATTLRRELHMPITNEHFWTDSEIVLGYIRNESKRFHMFVANRVGEINLSTQRTQWHHVASENNPADIASRGCDVEDLLRDKMWFTGPQFLQTADISQYVERQEVEISLDDKDPEVRTIKAMATAVASNPISDRLNRYSKWANLVKSLAILKSCIKRRQWKYQPLNSDDVVDAENFIIKTTQEKHFSTDTELSTIRCLHPIESDGLLRVGGRVQKSSQLSTKLKHPAIIPKGTHVAVLICRHYHDAVYHTGYRTTVAAIREAGFWIISSTTMIKRVIADCVTCNRLKKLPQQQLMGQLPPERTETTPPFTNIGLDVFGPFHIKERRTELKRWGLMVTCMYSRAVHIEVLEDMSTDNMIQALRCVIAIRGPIQTITSDNGTNFVGACNELEKEWNTGNLRNYLLTSRIEWKFNAPLASNQGGATERMIRSARAVLSALALKYKGRMDTKTFRTALYETANIINSRPLTATSVNMPEEQIITPNLLLNMKSSAGAPPPADFPEESIYGNKRWKVAQAIAQDFWQAWKSEYLKVITQRQKWTKERENLKMGDVVMLVDNQAARCDWKVGSIVSTSQGSDGLVRNVVLQLASSHLDNKGRRTESATVLRRPVNKVVVLLKQ